MPVPVSPSRAAADSTSLRPCRWLRHAISSAVAKSGVEPEAVEDVALGNGAHGAGNLGRLAGLLAGLPITTGGNTIQRHCSSGLNSIAVAANYIKVDGADCVVAGGVESISLPAAVWVDRPTWIRSWRRCTRPSTWP